LTTDKVARTLYGELSGQALTKAKEKVGKALWIGAKQKRWGGIKLDKMDRPSMHSSCVSNLDSGV
jgi:hypothetical protein